MCSILFLVGKRFRFCLPFSINMRGRCSLFKIKPLPAIFIITTWRVPIAIYPKFTRKDVTMLKVLQHILRRYVIGAAGFVSHLQPMLVAQLFKMAIIILRDTVLYSAIKILTKPCRYIGINNGVPR